MTPRVEETDVLIIGCGPVGALTANFLGLYGVRTLVLERLPTPHGQPRAITCDDEALRIYQAAGLSEPMDAHMYTVPEVQMTGADGELFARVVIQGLDFGNGFPALRFFSQPYVEDVLRQGLSRFPHVELRFGHSLEAYSQDAQAISATVRNTHDGSEYTVRARYLLACDGGRSTVRRIAGIEMVGSTYDEQMLAISLLLPEPPPPLCRMVCDPHRHIFVARCSGNEMRVDCTIRQDEKAEDLLQPERLREFIAPFVDPDRATILRAAAYVFNRRMASRWRDGRMFLLGDAAHLMPPVLGQGLCSGLRDAHNLSWKLASVLHGHADEPLLDTYEQERRPHVEAMLDTSVQMGRVVLTGNRPMAMLRDRVFRALDHIPRAQRFIRNFEFKPRPLISRGFMLGGSRGHRQAPEGTYFPQPRVGAPGGGEVRLDELMGPGFAVLVHPDTREASRRGAQALAESLGARCLRIIPPRSGQAQPGEVVDTEGKLDEWFREYKVEIAVIRPDRYLFGAVRGSHLAWLSTALRGWIHGPLSEREMPAPASALKSSVG
ncbi:bifunctional 3-(3-hydroxy-phenyl)propionate/3-hydroxycinnamic acid hydroxylase MhpA [Archangium lansingense]|uniref:Bifunctional 3-(3-hydroxy-phenyl)propionate/3-hydroxycinnamic acid hydroxylase n=1 Tax=Archangium lansingense TaxID=2995310 RepID=A0ABT3ZZ59_9BACT|nr:bifunctional 3-(3-hydroxy-phenyl)propionate/3-hydroxycinnamic acid hydroxylase [Archangium lansinium]MCY1073972.1 bifunctional 3-(3-hydroxy-phenyl)propionate/3-hydroxycinnamic acid hydroxylase [Archangium lansinium]